MWVETSGVHVKWDVQEESLCKWILLEWVGCNWEGKKWVGGNRQVLRRVFK